MLAGFVFTSIVFLIGSEGRRYAQALGLFCAAFVALGFDSYLYSALSGAVGNCSRVWAQTVVAGGLLGVGAMAMITGVIWLLSKHSFNEDEAQESGPISKKAHVHAGNPSLNGVVRTMAYGVSVAITALLGSTVYSYLYVVKVPGYFPSSWKIWIALPPIVIVVLTASFKILRNVHRALFPMKRPVSEVALRLATYGILVYALTGAVFIGAITEFPNKWWRAPPDAVILAIVIAGVIIPALLFIILIQAKPPPSAAGKESEEPEISETTAEILSKGTSTNGHKGVSGEVIQQAPDEYIPRHASRIK